MVALSGVGFHGHAGGEALMSFRAFKQILDAEPWGRAVQLKINNLFRGKMNIVGSVTLTANSATTALSDDLISPDSIVVVMPMTANAAAAIGGLYFSTPTAGLVTINHANNAQTDRTFRYGVMG